MRKTGKAGVLLLCILMLGLGGRGWKLQQEMAAAKTDRTGPDTEAVSSDVIRAEGGATNAAAAPSEGSPAEGLQTAAAAPSEGSPAEGLQTAAAAPSEGSPADGLQTAAAAPSEDSPAEGPQTAAASAPEENLPERWYAGDAGKKPAVRNQGSYGTCWAITAASALEASLLPQQERIFSAEHIVNRNSFAAGMNDGGDYLMLMAYLSSWQGPVTEEEDPYGDAYSPEGLSPAVHVQEIRVLKEAGQERLKAAILAYGSVQTSLYMDRAATAEGAGYYSAQNASYYYPEQTTQNHDILILGWDDSWPAEAFAANPGRDGAWICLNTWGEEFGEDGIFYVSYADANIGRIGIAYSRTEETENYDRLYQNDTCGWQGQQGYNSSVCWFAGVYTAESREELAAVGFYATGEHASYEIYLVHSFENEDSFGNMQLLQSGSLEDMGYYTADLAEACELAAGERFAVAVKIQVPGETNPVAVEYRSGEFTQNVSTEGKETYLSRYGSRWENTQEAYGTNVCLKAYTRELSA